MYLAFKVVRTMSGMAGTLAAIPDEAMRSIPTISAIPAPAVSVVSRLARWTSLTPAPGAARIAYEMRYDKNENDRDGDTHDDPLHDWLSPSRRLIDPPETFGG
jgi:hypothetical protein